MRLFLNGEEREVVVDDQFPCSGGEPAFSKSNGPELWVLLLEKAWAKVCRSYENTIIGYTGEALKALTGAPVKFLDHSFEEDIWEELLQADKSQ